MHIFGVQKMPDINNANKHLKTIMDYNKRIIGGDCTRGN